MPHLTDSLEGLFIAPQHKRWLHAYPDRSSYHCMDATQRMANHTDALRKVYEFLEVPAAFATHSTNRGDPHHEEVTTEGRIAATQDIFLEPGQSALDEVRAARQLIADIVPKYVNCDDVAELKATCGYVPSGYEHCAL